MENEQCESCSLHTEELEPLQITRDNNLQRATDLQNVDNIIIGMRACSDAGNFKGCERESETEYTSASTPNKVYDGSNFKHKSLQVSSRKGKPTILKSGWATKESGQAYFGKHNWRRRWFVLTLEDSQLILTYSEKIDSTEPKGIVFLSKDYSARELETRAKVKSNCFALGPALDKSALRTYYISCDNEDERLEWIVMLNSAIEGTPEKALKRQSTYRAKKNKRGLTRAYSDPVHPTSNVDTSNFILQSYRISQWRHVCEVAGTSIWKRTETKDGITVCRQSFKDTELVVVKVEGVIAAPMDVTFEFLQRSVKPGGKFDFVFRKEELIQKLEDKCNTAYITRKAYNVPLPGMKKRDVCVLRTFIPSTVSRDQTCGLLMFSVNHPQAPKSKEFERAFLSPSGIVLKPNEEEGETSSMILTAVFQIDLKDSLQNMLRGSYKSGVFRTGIRNFFQHLKALVQSYYELVHV